MNWLRRMASKGFMVSVTLSVVRSGWSIFKKIFGHKDKQPSLESEWDQGYLDVLKEERGNDEQ